jgi:putative ABC transport system ATP-binding protein
LTEALIQLDGVSKSYREGRTERCVLEKVSVSIAAGEIAVIVGRSGSGKSTLLNLLAGFDEPSSGRVVVAGRDLAGLGEHGRALFRRRSLGFVFQLFNLIPTLTVEENLLLPLELAGRVSEEDRERALGLLARVGLADRRASFPDRLSGGEKQRVAVARALAHDPELVIADEPTGNLDLDTGLEVLRLLDELVRSRGTTLVMATHSPEVVGLADRLFTIDAGRLRELARSEFRPPGGEAP